MTTTHGPAVSLLDDLRLALEALGDALARGAAADLLPIEERLTAAVERLPALLTAAGHAVDRPIERARIAEQAAAVAAALRRCRRLGGALTDVVHASLEAQGRTLGYGREGGERVDARLGALDARG
jgi:hypothetical protein